MRRESRRNVAGQLRGEGLGNASQDRPVGEIITRSQRVGWVVSDGRDVALHSSLGALYVHVGQGDYIETSRVAARYLVMMTDVFVVHIRLGFLGE